MNKKKKQQKSNTRQEIHDWWKQARADLKTAKDNITTKNYYASVLFSQQAAEKALKSLYIKLRKKFPPKTHDLVELCRLTKASKEITLVAGKLTVVYLPSHYPGVAPVIPVKYYDQEKAASHLKEARKILKWIQKKIK